jgi:four helix bundle protein
MKLYCPLQHIIPRMDATEAFARWETTTPPDMVGDSLWRLPAYRLSRFLAVLVDDDCKAIRKRSPYRAGQLERAVDSIGVNIIEGYGRLHGRERARFYEFALGSAREARDWYVRTEPWLKPGVANGRIKLLTRVIKILTVAIPEERAGSSERRIRDAASRIQRVNRDQKPE